MVKLKNILFSLGLTDYLELLDNRLLEEDFTDTYSDYEEDKDLLILKSPNKKLPQAIIINKKDYSLKYTYTLDNIPRTEEYNSQGFNLTRIYKI